MNNSNSLFVRCRGSLDNAVWSKAYEDFSHGRVTIGEDYKQGLAATVDGPRREQFDVTVDWSAADEDGVLFAECTCADCRHGRACRHIAAALLEADVAGLASHLKGRRELRIVCDDLADDGQDDEYWYDDDESDDDDGPYRLARRGTRSASSRRPTTTRRRAARRPNWRQILQSLADEQQYRGLAVREVSARQAKPREIWYRMNLDASSVRGQVELELCQRERRKTGEWGKIKIAKIDRDEIDALPDLDREILGLLLGSEQLDAYYNSYHWTSTGTSRCAIRPSLYGLLFPRLCATGRFGWIAASGSAPADELHPLTWDDGPTWEFKLRVALREADGYALLEPVIHRAGQEADLKSIRFLGLKLLIFDDVLAPLASEQAAPWLRWLQQCGPMELPLRDIDRFIEQLWEMSDLPPVDLPNSLGWRRTSIEPRPRIVISKRKYGDDSLLNAVVSFDYNGQVVPADEPKPVLLDPKARTIVPRDREREASWRSQLSELGLKDPPRYQHEQCHVQVPRKQFARAIETLAAAGWHVEAEGYRLRRPGSFKLSVSSGVDWFELNAQVDYEGTSVGLPELLAAARRGESFVVLDDGTRGMLPEEWLSRYAPLAAMGTPEGESLRFAHCQALLLDAWLAAQPDVDLDATFQKVRDRLCSFEGIHPRFEPAGFSGKLRDYQRDGLGWLHFLADFGFGGCLADDMGLGKTVQVLALLAEKHAQGGEGTGPALPSLVVVPRSLVHNWLEEARRFTPQLRVLDYTGLGRGGLPDEFGRYDVVVTTYGTLRRDAGHLKEVAFHYCILDEAQAIKNSASQAAKACRLLRARHRLAMTGTPVENHLGELWSLFEYLNPGMLGSSPTLQLLSGNGRGGDAGTVGLLAKALRPFLLRRTKEQVLDELPEKTEQTLYCELEGKQRKLYDELRNHYRESLAKRIESVGLQRAKIHVLEALLRLRQAACHPGLIDRSKQTETSAKLETLFEQLDEVLDEGHKALVFSQFTSLLAIVRRHLDQRGATYEYLDGKTRKRGEKVERFQQDASCKLFLISLKAGGLGLNLTAADYVFILDPWWNPAVEAQAVDRAHRIGQTRRVFAYRLIARDTVEEKILELQGDKRKLAEAIVSADNNLIRSLTADDLRLLLS